VLGDTIGPYRILEELGSGGFGTVYTARHLVENEIVAIKVLRAELAARADLRQRLLDEAQLLRSLPPHKNIVGLRDFGEAHGRPYLVMDHLAGQDLRDTLADGVLPIDQALDIAAQVADALAAAERGGLVHCDIKPENLRILSDGCVKVMDFGIARAADAHLREIAGTRAYMAPELWRGEPPEHASDVYALGCVLYEMLTGHAPFVPAAQGDREQAAREVAQQHLSLEPDWWPLQQEAAPASLVQLLRAMLAKVAEDRPRAVHLAAELRRLAGAAVAGTRLAGRAAADDDTTRPHPQAGAEDDDDITIRRGAPLPSTPHECATPTPGAALERIPSGVRVSLQRHLGTIDLGAEACRAALCHEGALLTGTLEGQVCRLDLRTGRVESWAVVPRSAVRSPAWAFAAYRHRLWLHAGDRDCYELEAAQGRVTGHTLLPEAAMSLSCTGGWLYMAGARAELYRAPLNDVERRERFDLGARLTGAPVATQGAVFAPTAAGLVCLDTHTRVAAPVGPQQTARAASLMPGRRLAVVYSAVAADGAQSSTIGLFDVAALPPRLLATVQASGQSAGPAQVAGDRIVVSYRDGRALAWDAVVSDGAWQLRQAWPSEAWEGLRVHSGAGLGAGLVALAPCNEREGKLVLLNAGNGRPVAEQPLSGEVFVAPLWWERTLSVIMARGAVEVFRITLVAQG